MGISPSIIQLLKRITARDNNLIPTDLLHQLKHNTTITGHSFLPKSSYHLRSLVHHSHSHNYRHSLIQDIINDLILALEHSRSLYKKQSFYNPKYYSASHPYRNFRKKAILPLFELFRNS